MWEKKEARMKFSWRAFAALFCLGTLAVLLQAIFAYNDSFLTVAQMQAKGFAKGLPLLYHGGIWGDFVFLTPLLAYLFAKYNGQWNERDILKSSAIGTVAIMVMGFIWVKAAQNGLPEAHTYNGGVTMAGSIHGMYFVVAITIILMTFFHTAISKKAATIIAVILGLHIVYGTHIVLGLIGPAWYTDRPHENPVTWITILVSWALLFWRCRTIH